MVASGGAGVFARTEFSSALIRRVSRHLPALESSHIGSSPSRNESKTSAGTLVSRIYPSQIFTSIGFQLFSENSKSATRSTTQTAVRMICMATSLAVL